MELKVKGCKNENISIYKTKNHPHLGGGKIAMKKIEAMNPQLRYVIYKKINDFLP